MNTKNQFLKKALYVILSLAVIGIVIFRLVSNKKITQEKVYQFNKEKALYVQADTIKLEDVAAQSSYSGTFEPNKESKISAEVQGKINEVLVDAGSVVRKGETLIQLDNSLLKLQLQTVEAQVQGLEADVNRYTILARADAIQGIQLEKSELGLKSAKIQKATLLEQISKSSIKAPFNGVVTAKLTEVGAFAAPGVPLLQITDITELKFTIQVSENEISQFKLHQDYFITSDAYPEIPLKGKATMIGSKANMGSSFPVQFAVTNSPDLKIKSGMFGKIILKTEGQEKGIIIPSSAIIETDEKDQVYVIQNGKAMLRNITVSRNIENKAVVAAGLTAGDVIVTNGFINLFDSANVIAK